MMALSVVKDFSDNLVDEEPHHLNPMAQNLRLVAAFGAVNVLDNQGA